MDNQNRVQEILSAYGLDFRIEKAPMVAINALNETVKSPYFGLINSKTGHVIHTVKEGYKVSQNDEVIELVLKGIDSFGEQLSVSKAGSINGGRKIFIQLAIEGLSKVSDDNIKKFITIIDSNDGSHSLSIGVGDVTMSCMNQFNRFYKSGQKFRHSASLEEKLKSLPLLIETALGQSLKQIETYNKFASTPVSRMLAHKLVRALLGHDRHITSIKEQSELSTRSINIMDALYDSIEKEMNSKGETLWGLHSGVTNFTTHHKSAPKRENGRDESILIGAGYKLNQKSFDFAEKFAQVLDYNLM